MDALYAESVTHILLDVFAIPALAHDLADTLAQPQLWLDHAMALLEARPDCHLLLQLPRIGAPTAAAILTASGDLRHSTPMANSSSNWRVSRSACSKAAPVSGSSRRSHMAQ